MPPLASLSEERDLSPRAAAALNHLRKLRPADRYTVESYLSTSGKRLVRLKRRGVPLRDGEGFVDLVIPILGTGRDGTIVGDARGCVVGIEVATSNGSMGRGFVLVDRSGSPVRVEERTVTVTVDMKDVLAITASGGDARPRSFSSRLPGIPPGAARTNGGNNDALVRYGLMAVVGLMVLKVLLAAMNMLSMLMVPLGFFYASQNCPSAESFDAKVELKRVMRGAHLPEQQQPQGFFEGAFNRLQASISTELATSLGYEVTITDYLGAARMATVRVPVAKADYTWIGIFGKWRFFGQREILDQRND